MTKREKKRAIKTAYRNIAIREMIIDSYRKSDKYKGFFEIDPEKAQETIEKVIKKTKNRKIK